MQLKRNLLNRVIKSQRIYQFIFRDNSTKKVKSFSFRKQFFRTQNAAKIYQKIDFLLEKALFNKK